jgi:WD40 repeat protein
MPRDRRPSYFTLTAIPRFGYFDGSPGFGDGTWYPPSASSTFYFTTTDSTIRIWDLADATEARTVFGHEGFVLAVAFGPDGTALASASEDHSVRLWETATGRPLASFLGHASHASALTFEPRGRWVASGGEAGEVKVWDLRQSRPVVYRGQSGWVTGVAFSWGQSARRFGV